MQQKPDTKGIPFLNRMTMTMKLSILLAVISCMVYANTVQNGYVLDDSMMITQNNIVQQGMKGVPMLFMTSHLKGFEGNLVTDNYRPLSLVMFAVEFQLFGLNPLPGHVINILVFAACVVALFFFFNKLFNGDKIVAAFIAALLFAVHPIHTEVVANIKSRDELLCFFFAFLSFIVYLNYARQGKLYQLIFASLYLFLSYLSKETVVTFIGMIPLVFFLYKNENIIRSVSITISSVAVLGVFMLIRHFVLKSNETSATIEVKLVLNLLVNAPDAASKLATEILILGYYIKTLFIPYPLTFFYGYNSIPFVGFGDFRVLLSLTLYLFLLVSGVRKLFKNKKDPWAFAVLFYLASIALFSNIPFLVSPAYADRFAFFPSVGFCLFVALVFEKRVLYFARCDTWKNKFQANAQLRGKDQNKPLLSPQQPQLPNEPVYPGCDIEKEGGGMEVVKRVTALAVLGSIVAFFSVLTIYRNLDWKDNYTLVFSDLPKSLNDTWLQYYAGLELQRKFEEEPDSLKAQKINEESIRHFLKSLEIYPANTETHADIGVAYMRTLNFDSAGYHFIKAYELRPVDIRVARNLATMYFRQQDFINALYYYRKTIEIDSNETMAWYNMGACYSRLQKPDSSIFCFRKVLAIDPGYEDYKPLVNLALLYKITGQMDSARKYEQTARPYYPEFSL